MIFANSALGARNAKHADFLDLCIALTGRAPLSGVYLESNRRARRVVAVERANGADDSFWPLVGYLAGRASPDRIPLLCGLADAEPSRNDLKALCVAFGTTSGAPMLHIVGVTPEAGMQAAPDANRATIARSDLASAWLSLNQGPETIDLVAIGSPHASPAKSGRSPARRPPGAGGRRGDRDRRPGRSRRCAEGRGAFAPRGRRRAGPARSLLVLDLRAGLPGPGADGDDQVRQVRALRAEFLAGPCGSEASPPVSR